MCTTHCCLVTQTANFRAPGLSCQPSLLSLSIRTVSELHALTLATRSYALLVQKKELNLAGPYWPATCQFEWPSVQLVTHPRNSAIHLQCHSLSTSRILLTVQKEMYTKIKLNLSWRAMFDVRIKMYATNMTFLI